MVSTGDTAPTFSATLASSDPEPFALSEHLGDGPVVLAFFPGAFTPPCTSEMVALQEHIGRFRDAGAAVYGVSADSALSQREFSEKHGLEFGLISDMGRDAIDAYGLTMDIPGLGLRNVANRAVFVLDSEGTVTYQWVADDPTNEPDYEALLDAVAAA